MFYSYCLRREIRSLHCIMDKSQVIKSGILKKVKRGKKRFFVLRRDESNLSASRLDCFETEKKFIQGTTPKSSLLIAEFFNVNRLSLVKNEFCIAIYTKDNSLYLSCDNIAEQESWLQALVELVEEERAGMPSSSFSSAMTQTISSTTVPRGQMPAGKPLFEFCWEVVVTKFESKDGSHPRKCPRPNCAYRFCLTEELILLFKKLTKTTDPEDDWTFELNSVSSYGLQGEIFYLTVGRFTITGSGQLFMKGEDSTTTGNIYKTLQKTFEETKSRRKSISEIKKSIGLTPRSSTISRERSNSVATQNRTRGYSESEKTLMNAIPIASSMASSPGTPGFTLGFSMTDSHGSMTSPIATAFRKTSAHIFHRMRTSSEEFCDISLSAAHRKSSESSLRPAAIACRSYQQQKAPSAEALESDPRLRQFPAATASGFSKPPGATYSRFDSHNCSTDSVGSSYSAEENAYYGKPRCPSAELVDRSAIKEETPGDDYLPMEKIPSVNVTSASAPQSKGPSSPDGYLMMAQIPASQGGYCAMSAEIKPELDMNTWKKLEEVKSYISDSGESWPDPTSVRSYSLGSRPTNQSVDKQERPGHPYRQDTDEVPVGIPSSLSSETCQITQEDRRRAYSFGNWRKPSVMAKYRRHQHGLFNSVVLDYSAQNSAFRVRSESFGSSGKNSARSRDRKANNFYGDDLVELDFGTSFNKSPASSSLGSSESLQNRSRAGSTVQRSWSPKIEELMEENISGQSPSGRLIAKLFSPTRETPGDYVFMGLNPQSPGPIEPQLDSLYVTATSPTMGIADLNISEIVLQSPSSGYMMMSSPSTTTSVVKNAPEVCGEEIWLEQKIMVGVCPIQDDSVITPRSTEEAEEDPFCVVEIGAASRELTGEKAASALYENLIIPEVTVGRIQSTVSSDYGVVGTGDKDGIKKDEWKVPSVNRPLVRPSSVALDKPETSSFLNLSQSPRGRSSLTLSDRPAEKVMRSSSVCSTQPLPGGKEEKTSGARMKSPLLKLFNSAIGRHSSDDLKSKATPPPSPSYLAMGPTKVRRESGHEIDQQRHTAQQRHQDMGEPFESQLTPVLMDRSHTDSGLVSSCALDCRRISSGVPATIEYASLEFQSCGGDGQKTPAFIPSIATQCGTTGYSDSNATVYAQIDLSKSEAIKKCVRH